MRAADPPKHSWGGLADADIPLVGSRGGSWAEGTAGTGGPWGKCVGAGGWVWGVPILPSSFSSLGAELLFLKVERAQDSTSFLLPDVDGAFWGLTFGRLPCGRL